MLGIDTNVLVRLLVRDNEAQFARAQELLKREVDARTPVLISLLVLLETEWVLRSRYRYTKGEIDRVFADLLNSFDVRFEDESSVVSALFIWKDSAADLADCLIGLRHRELRCRATSSFDQKALELPGWVAV